MAEHTIDPILEEIHAFLKKEDMPPTRFGWLAMRDVNLVRDLEAGRELRRSSVAKVRAVLDGSVRDESAA